MFLSWSAGMGSVRCCQDVKSRMARGDSQASELNSNKLHDSVQLNAHSHSQKNSSRLAEFRTTYTPTRRSNAPAKSWRLKQTERPSSRHCWALSNTRHRVPLREPSQQFNGTEQKCPKRLSDSLRHGTVGSVCTHSSSSSEHRFWSHWMQPHSRSRGTSEHLEYSLLHPQVF